MATLEAPPPSRHISSTPISQAAASLMLDTYLRNTEAHAHLHPDALITPTGVTFSSHGGPAGGVVLHNLRRVAAGLHGEYLEPEGTPEPEEEEEGEDGGGEWGAVKGSGKGKGKGKKGEGWQDREVAAQEEEGLVIGEVGDRTNGVVGGGVEPEVRDTGLGEEAKKRKGDGGGKMDKEARKKAKKERDQQRKRENEAKKAD
ncbi:predicted protein [Plenodomus lingam JN3]|uniref:Uncharacterized protein n=1 Tax=Leptosphaeria maculans (strain JN3 / isolate v23.1.3 / race Av1-4-5-6-7-8) TaxID=985895 RepID=E4ZGJ0_LEPMJ|nr:predicted protein [Plenodomus lingam JN3]CBX90410.1 predicted protein [Plenodomus lingam JN3]